MLLERIIKEIKAKKELKNLDDGFVKARIKEYAKQNGLSPEGDFEKVKRAKWFKEMFKCVRKGCRLVYGAFQDVKEQRSRVVYERIFNEVRGDVILDIGCGNAPLEYCSLYENKKYYLCEIDCGVITKLSDFMKKNKIKGRAFVFNAVDDNIERLPKADTVLLLKVLESFELIKRDISYEILKKLKCRKIVVSFSKVALGGGVEIRKAGRAWFRRMLDRLGYKYTIGDIEKEIFFFIDK